MDVSRKVRIYLSPPSLDDAEVRLVTEAIESNWIAPLGPQVDAFEEELAIECGVAEAAALVSGTAGIHLALLLAGVGPGDRVICPTLTFVASVNPVLYVGASPIFVDSNPATWTLDPDLLAEALDADASAGTLPKAVIAVDLYGQCVDYGRIEALCRDYGVALIEDAAEALGSTAYGQPAGSFGDFGVLSFNGNKIVTTSGGGALLSDDVASVSRARFLASQAREPAPQYEHVELGYNYRLSNILAAIGRGQLRGLGPKVAARREVFSRYVTALAALPGVDFMPEAPYGVSNRWLTTLTIDPEAFGATREDVRIALEREDIESRPLWKPMHLQPLYEGAPQIGGKVAASLYRDGLCLPSGTTLIPADIERIVEIISTTHRA